MRVFTDLEQLPAFSGTVITIGSFDGVHAGHRLILERVCNLARAHQAKSVVITFSPHPRTVLRPEEPFQLLTDNDEKSKLMADIGIDYLVRVPFSLAFAQQSAHAYLEDFLWKKFQPHTVVIGYDHRFGANREGDLTMLEQYAAERGFTVLEIPARTVDDLAVSSTKIRQALLKGEVTKANKLLGHSFTLSGTVVHGDQLGRTIGFPTANLRLAEPQKMVPPDGIYAARVQLANGEHYDAMLYIGHRPTLHAEMEQRIEANLLNFSGDLYGQFLTIQVFDFIRGDRQLEGLAALQVQIEADKAVIVQRLSNQNQTHTNLITRDICIVVLNYNTRAHLATYLPSVKAFSKGARIVVADNGSPDDSVTWLRTYHPDVEVLVLPENYGFAEGYNVALRQVDAKVYVILNSDVEVTEGWLEAPLRLLLNDSTVGVVQPKVRAWYNKGHFEHAGAAGGWIDVLGYPFCRGRLFAHTEEDRGQYDTPQQCFWAAGAAFFVRAELYHQMGGFDGDYFAHNEEIDFCWRVKRAGYSVWCLPDSVVYHLGGGTLGYDSSRKIFLNFRNSLYSLVKNEPLSKLLWLVLTRLLLDGVAAIMFGTKGRFDAILAILRAHGSFYQHFGALWAKRAMVAERVARHRIGPMNRVGMHRRSVVFQYYVRRIKQFSRLGAEASSKHTTLPPIN